MACVTLKRPFEVLNGSPQHHESPLAKRKRCGPPLQTSLPPSPAKVKRFKRMIEFEDEVPDSRSSSQVPSPFIKATPPLDSDKLALSLEVELRRFQKKKLFTSELPQAQGEASAVMMTTCHSPLSKSREQPLFTLKQVVMVCQRKLQEREEELREEYDKVLSGKLAEQYDAFVRFSRDQIERKYHKEDMSYIS